MCSEPSPHVLNEQDLANYVNRQHQKCIAMKLLPAGGVAVPTSEVHTAVCSLILENADRSGIVVYMPRRLHCNLDSGG